MPGVYEYGVGFVCLMFYLVAVWPRDPITTDGVHLQAIVFTGKVIF